LLEGGVVRCWGDNRSGQLGLAPDDTAHPASVVVSVGGEAVALRAGDNHTCALLADATVACWGANAEGQLGDGTVEAVVGIGVIDW
jgi:alpha-tubulin suppressor-like RCC1 family protein